MVRGSTDVILPVRNGAAWIGKTLDSVLAQSRPAREVVVVDDGSTDETVAIVRSYPSVVLVHNPGSGPASARNHGFGLTGSEFVTFLDADDLWHEEHLALLLELLERKPSAPATIARADCFCGDAPTYEIIDGREEELDPWPRFPFTMGIEGPSVAVMRRAVHADVGQWDERASGVGDLLLFLKLAVPSPLLRIRSCTVGKRIHPRQLWIELRAQHPDYLGFRAEVMRLALDFRTARLGEDAHTESLERRLESLAVLSDLTRAIRATDWSMIPRIASDLERGLRGESLMCIRHSFYCLMGDLFQTHDVELLREMRDETFLALADRWPSSADRTREVLLSMIGEQPLAT